MSDYGEKKGHGSLRQNGLRAASLIPDSSLSSIQPAFQPGNPDLLLLNVAGSFENRLFPLVPKLPFGNDGCRGDEVRVRPQRQSGGVRPQRQSGGVRPQRQSGGVRPQRQPGAGAVVLAARRPCGLTSSPLRPPPG